jgi:hypothetical protein
MPAEGGFCMKIREMPADIKVQCQKVGFIVWKIHQDQNMMVFNIIAQLNILH